VVDNKDEDLLRWMKVVMPVHQCTPVLPSDGIRRQSSLSEHIISHQHSFRLTNTQAYCHTHSRQLYSV